jgi:hypothetical protein
MLRNHLPQISLIGISSCDGLSWESVLSLMRETTIATIFNNEEDEELRISAIEYLSYINPESRLIDILSHDSLLHRLVELLSSGPSLQNDLWFLRELTERGYPDLVVKAGVIDVIIGLFDSFTMNSKFLSSDILEMIATHSRPHLLKVSLSPPSSILSSVSFFGDH